MVDPRETPTGPKSRLLRRLVREQVRARLGPLLDLRGRSRHLTGARNRNRDRLSKVDKQLDDCTALFPRPPFTSDMTIDRVWKHHPDAPSVFGRYHLDACDSCAVRFDETLAEAASAYDLDLVTMLEELNSLLEGP